MDRSIKEWDGTRCPWCRQRECLCEDEWPEEVTGEDAAAVERAPAP